MANIPKCPKCQGSMEEGFMPDGIGAHGKLLFRVRSEKRLQFYARFFLLVAAALYGFDSYQEHQVLLLSAALR